MTVYKIKKTRIGKRCDRSTLLDFSVSRNSYIIRKIIKIATSKIELKLLQFAVTVVYNGNIILL